MEPTCKPGAGSCRNSSNSSGSKNDAMSDSGYSDSDSDSETSSRSNSDSDSEPDSTSTVENGDATGATPGLKWYEWTHPHLDNLDWLNDLPVSDVKSAKEVFAQICRRRDANIREFLQSAPKTDLVSSPSHFSELELFQYLMAAHLRATGNTDPDNGPATTTGQDQGDSNSDPVVERPRNRVTPNYHVTMGVNMNGYVVPYYNSIINGWSSELAMKGRNPRPVCRKAYYYLTNDSMHCHPKRNGEHVVWCGVVCLFACYLVLALSLAFSRCWTPGLV